MKAVPCWPQRVDMTSNVCRQPGVNVHQNHSTEWRRPAKSLRQQQPVTLFSLSCALSFSFSSACFDDIKSSWKWIIFWNTTHNMSLLIKSLLLSHHHSTCALVSEYMNMWMWILPDTYNWNVSCLSL